MQAPGPPSFKRRPKYCRIDIDTMDYTEILTKLYVNRSITKLYLRNPREASLDATQALYTSKRCFEAFIARGKASIEMHMYPHAEHDFQEACKLRKSRYAQKLRQYAQKMAPQQELLEELEEEMFCPAPRPSYQAPSQTVQWQEPEPVEIPQQEISDRVFDFDNFHSDDAREVMDIVRSMKLLSPQCFAGMLVKISDIFHDLPNIVRVDGVKKITIAGDTHGQLQDVLYIFDKFGYPSEENPYLFNGDFVDRGSQGLEILMVLFAWKIAEPKGMFINRGNHESAFMNSGYGFSRECTAKLGSDIFEMCGKVFEFMPLGHVICGKVFVVHGGLFSDESVDIETLQQIDRMRQPPDSGLMNDILWSDPVETPGIGQSLRGGGTIVFGPDVTEAFLQRNNLELVIRSHQVMEDGYKVHHGGKCVTVFSAPNYIGRLGNKGAVCKISFEDGKMMPLEFEQFEANPIPEGFTPMIFSDFSQFGA